MPKSEKAPNAPNVNKDKATKGKATGGKLTKAEIERALAKGKELKEVNSGGALKAQIQALFDANVNTFFSASLLAIKLNVSPGKPIKRRCQRVRDCLRDDFGLGGEMGSDLVPLDDGTGAYVRVKGEGRGKDYGKIDAKMTRSYL